MVGKKVWQVKQWHTKANSQKKLEKREINIDFPE